MAEMGRSETAAASPQQPAVTGQLEKGMTVFARIDHAEAARNAGLAMPPTQVLIYDNAKRGPLRALATVVHAGPQIATAEARVEDAKGQLYAHATTSCFVFDVPAV